MAVDDLMYYMPGTPYEAMKNWEKKIRSMDKWRGDRLVVFRRDPLTWGLTCEVVKNSALEWYPLGLEDHWAKIRKDIIERPEEYGLGRVI